MTLLASPLARSSPERQTPNSNCRGTCPCSESNCLGGFWREPVEYVDTVEVVRKKGVTSVVSDELAC